MTSKQDCRDALTLALERGIAGKTDDALWRFYNASPLLGLSKDWKKALLCEQGFRPEFLSLEKQKFSVLDKAPTKADAHEGAIFLLGRNRKWNEHKLSEIWNALKLGGRLIVAGDKSGGIGSIRKWFGNHVPIINSFSKYHAVVFWADKNSSDRLPTINISNEVNGYHVQEGMFSSEGPDKASLLLVEHFDDRLRGKVADLGAGWGYLSGEAMKRSARLEAIDLFEADSASLSTAETNLDAFQIAKSFNWIDVTSEFPKKPYDWVIMNPPFHSGSRVAEPELGKRFIDVASFTLPSGGRLLMVANKNLPYEKTLGTKFRRFEKLCERDGFKVFEAVK